jgi:hypothetical protein
MSAVLELEFDSDEWSKLTSSERIRRCRLFAEHARQHAAGAAPEVKKIYQELSQNWLALAEEIENSRPNSAPSARPFA